jgi:hypothetical protein
MLGHLLQDSMDLAGERMRERTKGVREEIATIEAVFTPHCPNGGNFIDLLFLISGNLNFTSQFFIHAYVIWFTTSHTFR